MGFFGPFPADGSRISGCIFFSGNNCTSNIGDFLKTQINKDHFGCNRVIFWQQLYISALFSQIVDMFSSSIT